MSATPSPNSHGWSPALRAARPEPLTEDPYGTVAAFPLGGAAGSATVLAVAPGAVAKGP